MALSDTDKPPPEYLSRAQVERLWVTLERDATKSIRLYLAAQTFWPSSEGSATVKARAHPLIQEAYARSIEPKPGSSTELRRPVEAHEADDFLKLACGWLKSIASELQQGEARKRGDFQTVKQLKTKLTRTRRELSKEGGAADDPVVAPILNDLGVVLQHAKDMAGAIKNFSEAVAIQKKALAARSNKVTAPQVVASLEMLAVALRAQGEYREAAERHEEALSLLEQTLGTEHLALSGILKGLADVRRGLGEFEVAEQKIARALAIQERALAAKDQNVSVADVIATCSALANVLAIQGKTRDAKAFDKRKEALRGELRRGKARRRPVSAEQRRLSQLIAKLAGVQPDEVVDGVMAKGASNPELSAIVKDAVAKLRELFADRPDLMEHLEDRIRTALVGDDEPAKDELDQKSKAEQEAEHRKADATRKQYGRDRNRLFPEG